MTLNTWFFSLIIFWGSGVQSAYTQAYVVIRGKIVNQSTQQAVPYASIQVLGRTQGTSANEVGEFVFHLDKRFHADTLLISSIGYRSLRKLVGEDSRYEVITLTPVTTELREVTVQGESALDLVKRVVAKIPETHDTSDYHMSAFYRENTWLGKDELQYNEGVLDILKSFKADDKNPTDQIRVVKSRKKKIDFGKGGVLYYWLAGPSNGARFSLGEDMIKYRNRKWSVFNPTQYRYYAFEYGGVIRDGERSLVIVDIKPKKKSRKGLFNMKVFIDEDDAAIVRYEYFLTEEGVRRVEKQDKGVGYSIASVAYGVSLNYHHFAIKCSYQEHHGKWYLSSVKRHFEILVNSRKRNMDKTLWTSDILFQVTGIDTENRSPITEGNIGDSQDRFGTLANDEYDESFWENYNIIKPVVPDSLMQPIEVDMLTRKASSLADKGDELYYNNQAAFTRADTLRGKLTPIRSCYDVTIYHLDVEVNMNDRSVKGSNLIRFKVVNPFQVMQVDLFANMKIDSIIYKHKPLTYTREADAVFIEFPETIREGEKEIKIYYGGIPVTPDWNVPMKGGVLWDEDNAGNPWAQVVCQGSGASLWWPNKDHLSDEPDSMKIWITVPEAYTDVSNGRLKKKTPLAQNRMRYEWEVSYPINNYNVTFNIGKYTHFRDLYVTGDTLTIDYYVMTYNRARADSVFAPVKTMLSVFEKYFGKYPFRRDGFALVESIYPMEHQSGVCLGKLTVEHTKGYFPLMWHESAHEWWGNAIGCTDMADMWFHEAFATYAEALMVEHEFGKEQGTNFLRMQGLSNKYPIVGMKDVNHIFYDINDMYGKGSMVLHTLRNVLDNDSLWFDLLRSIQNRFRYRTLTSDELIAFINEFTGRDFTAFFDHYLNNVAIPELQIRTEQKGKDLVVHHRWENVHASFTMPAKVTTTLDKWIFIHPTHEWQITIIPDLDEGDFEVDEVNFLIEVSEE